jgi:hypothetical protein
VMIYVANAGGRRAGVAVGEHASCVRPQEARPNVHLSLLRRLLRCRFLLLLRS